MGDWGQWAGLSGAAVALLVLDKAVTGVGFAGVVWAWRWGDAGR